MFIDRDSKLPGILRIKIPQELTIGLNKKIEWICGCGKETTATVSKVLSGHTKSCGKCNMISAEEMKTWKPYRLKIKYQQDIFPNSGKKATWLCDCGRESDMIIYNVMSGNARSCGKCNMISAEEMKTWKPYRLKMLNPKDTLPGSNEIEEWLCDCGNTTLIPIVYVTNGNTKSCGRCFETIYDWFFKNKEEIRSLKSPIKPEDFPKGGPILLETITNTNKKAKFMCKICNNVYYPRLCDIKQNNGGLTCGCTSNRISSGQKDVFNFIRSLGVEAELEYPVNKLKYDIFVPSCNLLIEYNGTRWHSMPGSKARDERKRNNAILNNFEFMVITEVEWEYNCKSIKTKIENNVLKLANDAGPDLSVI